MIEAKVDLILKYSSPTLEGHSLKEHLSSKDRIIWQQVLSMALISLSTKDTSLMRTIIGQKRCP